MNMLAQIPQNQKTISTLEIANVTLKRHADVKRDTEVMAHQLGLDVRKFAHIYSDSMNRDQTEYQLTKKLSLCLVSGYSAQLRMAIIERWEELENAQAKLPQSFAEALQLAADQAKQIELAAPKVQYFDAVADRKNLINASQVAQKFGMSAVIMNRHLESLKVYNKTIKRGRVFNSWFEQQGYGELKQTDAGFPQAMFTNSGEQWIYEKFVTEGII